MLHHCSHNIDTNVLLQNAHGCIWEKRDATFDTKGCIEVDELPNKVGRWKVGDWYYELNHKMNWMRWSHDGERFSYTWSRRTNKGDDKNHAEQMIENEVAHFMKTIQLPVGSQLHRLVGGRGAHVGEFLLLADVDVHITGT